MKDFYFVYGYDKKKANRLYRFYNGNFERYDKNTNLWVPAPEQACIFVGEDWDYDEITAEEAEKIKEILLVQYDKENILLGEEEKRITYEKEKVKKERKIE